MTILFTPASVTVILGGIVACNAAFFGVAQYVADENHRVISKEVTEIQRVINLRTRDRYYKQDAEHDFAIVHKRLDRLEMLCN